MNDDAAENTQEKAHAWGIETSYFDIQGRQQWASTQALQGIIAAMSETGFSPALTPAEQGLPLEAYQGDGRRHWILAVQLYAVRSRRNWGHGDFTDLKALVELAADVGAAGVGLNPLHVLFSDRPEDPSPYAPNSRLFLNPLYIDVAGIPEFPESQAAEFHQTTARLRNSEMVNYGAVAEIKISALRLAYRSFRVSSDHARQADFESFREERGRNLKCFAAFEILRHRHSGPWWEWPEPWHKPDDAVLNLLRESDSEEIGFYEFVQWVADRQLDACQQKARQLRLAIGLYIDLAVGVDASGADGWIGQDVMLNGLSVGAPPDAYNPAGQDWGLTTFNPHGLAARQFEPLREMLRASMRHAGAVRIDHVLGLMRLYVIPQGRKPQDGAYLRFPFTALLRVVAEESQHHQCIVIGEDLGTVPEGFRETMAAWGLWSYLVVMFEREWDGSFRQPAHYRERALATFSTHDLPTFAGWISGHDLALKRSIGVDSGESNEDRERAQTALKSVVAPGGDVSFESIVSFLAATPARLISVAIEDVLGVQDQVNIPGTVVEYPNWRRVVPVAIEDLHQDQRLRTVAAACARAGRAPG